MYTNRVYFCFMFNKSDIYKHQKIFMSLINRHIYKFDEIFVLLDKRVCILYSSNWMMNLMNNEHQYTRVNDKIRT